MPIDQIVLVGPHASGKSTLGHRLAKLLGWSFHSELGLKLRKEALATNSKAHAAHSDESFDRLIFAQEAQRDRLNLTPRVIETWHIGNLAYVEHRTPQLRAELLESITPLLLRQSPRTLFIPLSISRETLATRLHEPSSENKEDFISFLSSVGSRATQLIDELQLQRTPYIHTDHTASETSLLQICRELQTQLLATSATLISQE